MAYDVDLADRVREVVGDRPGVTEVRMFGGLASLVRGNMAVVVPGKGGLLVRVDPADHDALLADEGAETMVIRGRPMRGWITVAANACAAPADLASWVQIGCPSGRMIAWMFAPKSRCFPDATGQVLPGGLA